MRLVLWTALCLCVEALAARVPDTTQRRAVPSGFVTTNGKQFELDGAPFSFVGANVYWLPLLTSSDDVELTFQDIQGQGIKVVRTWGFNAINGSELAGAIESGLTYYQLWNSSQWILNDGPQGLQRLDNVVSTAAKYDIRLIITFTNNWVGYGGSDLFLNWIVGSEATHDLFFTNKDVIASYQSYVQTIVDRYKNSSSIFAWELMNEARCISDTLPAGPNCIPGTETLNTWYRQQSDFVRSLDPDHMITTGGEGQFYWAQPPVIWTDNVPASDYNFDGRAGEDFELDLRLPNIDFGSYHMYPQTWYPQLDFPGSNFSVEDWGLNWMQAHADTADMVGKPVIIEEFGLTGLDNKTTTYPSWVQRALDTNHAGIMPWQFGQLNLTESGGNRLIKYADQILDGASPNDGFAIYTNETSVLDIFT
ncbi:glycoside hydrolase [Phellopilus nigrolimitatus]|nr:glycoside hydrolase [Phellopilus nigrolimitatus]